MQDTNADPTCLEEWANFFASAVGTSILEWKGKDRWRRCLVDTTSTFEGAYLPPKLGIAIHERGAPQNSQELSALREMQQSAEEKSCVVLPIWGDARTIANAESIFRETLKQTYLIDPVVLKIDQIQKIIGASRPDLELQHIVLPQIRLSYIHPYQKTGAVKSNIFFGRDQYLRQIVTGLKDRMNYVVIGGRRIGKSSILTHLAKVQLPALDFRCVYLDVADVENITDLHDIALLWDENEIPGLPDTFGELLEKPPKGRSLVILLDEADKLVDLDTSEAGERNLIFQALRTFANNGLGSFVLGGEYALRQALHDSNGPLYNFGNEILLGPLESPAVTELVRGPMKRMQIELVGEESILSEIFERTAGHPSIVQSTCMRLVERLNTLGSRRITMKDVDAVFNDPDFQVNDFLETYWERANYIEQIISILMTREQAKYFSLQDILDLLARGNVIAAPAEVSTALDKLVSLRLILSYTSQGYSFATTSFPKVLSNSKAVDDKLLELVDKYHQSQKGGARPA
jgi:hypothetical protein